MKQEREKITFSQVLTRIICVLVMGIGISSCVFSLTLQIEEIGTMMSSVLWFSGLGATVVAAGGYAASCKPRQGTSWIIPALLLTVFVAATAFELELDNLHSYEVAFVAIVAMLVCAAWLVVYHFILKFKDPEAI